MSTDAPNSLRNSQIVLNEVILRANKLEIRVCELQNELKSCKLEFENELKQERVQWEKKLRTFVEKEELDKLSIDMLKTENEKLKEETVILKTIKIDLESKLKESELSTNKLREQIDGMNKKFDEWRVNYNDLNIRLCEMDKIESKIKENINALMEENEKLRIINKNGDNIIQLYTSELNQAKQKFEQKYADKCTELEKCKEAIRLIEAKNNNLTQRLIEAKKDFESTNESLNSMYQEKEDLEKKLLKSQQANAANVQIINDLKASNKIIESSLKEKTNKIDALEREKVNLTSQYQNDKITDEIHINELKQKLKKFDIELKNETDEKASLKTKYEELRQQLRTAEGQLNELSEILKKLRSRKLYDNFTQTVPHIDSVSSCNKFTQTNDDDEAMRREKTTNDIDIQTVEKVMRNKFAQTEAKLNIDVEVQTDSVYPSELIEPAEKEQQAEDNSNVKDALYLVNLGKSKEYLLNKRFLNKNLAYRDNRDDLNRLFGKQDAIESSEISDKENKKANDDAQNDGDDHEKSSTTTSSKANSTKRKSVKRVRFSENS